MSGDWLALGAVGSLVIAAEATRRSTRREERTSRLSPDESARFEFQTNIDFDPDETGDVRMQKDEAFRVCPFGHRQQKCSCEMRPGYWLESRRSARLAFRQGSNQQGEIVVVRTEPKHVGFSPNQMMKAMSRGQSHDPNRVVSVIVTLSHPDASILLTSAARIRAIVAATQHIYGARYARGVSGVYPDPRSAVFHIRYEVQ